MSSTPSITCRCGSRHHHRHRQPRVPSKTLTGAVGPTGAMAPMMPMAPRGGRGVRLQTLVRPWVRVWPQRRLAATTRARAARARNTNDATAPEPGVTGTQTLRDLVSAIEQVLIGKHSEAELAIIGLAAGGHLLIEDVPGVGKTMLAKSLARATGCTFKRIQFTPDLLPSDVTGVSIYNQRTAEFEFRAGPIVAHVVLADEINRATPKTQSALLEAMEEQQVTVEGVTRPLPSPFMVLATQNPIEYEGTFPLPEAQLDRFLLRIHLGYPEPSQEAAVMERQMVRHHL